MHGEFRLRGLENCERSGGAAEVKQATAVGRDSLVVASAGAEEIAELVIAATEWLRRGEALEPPHASCAPFHAPMALFKPVVLVDAGPVHDPPPERRADRTRVGAVTVRGDALRDLAGDRHGRAEERLGRRHVAVLAEHDLDRLAVAVDGPI